MALNNDALNPSADHTLLGPMGWTCACPACVLGVGGLPVAETDDALSVSSGMYGEQATWRVPMARLDLLPFSMTEARVISVARAAPIRLAATVPDPEIPLSSPVPALGLMSSEDSHLSGRIYHWRQRTLIDGVAVSSGVNGPAALTDTAGEYSLTFSGDALVLSASRPTQSNDLAGITSADALAALKIALGRNPNADPDGPGPLQAPAVSPYQLIAADVDGDGVVTREDARAILAIATGQTLHSNWLFIHERLDVWDEQAAQFTISRSAVGSAGRESIDYLPQAGDAATLNWVAVLAGDVDGSGPVNAGDAVLEAGYLADLVASNPTLMHATQFALTSADVVSRPPMPYLLSAATTTDGLQVLLQFDKPLSPDVALSDSFRLFQGGTPLPIAEVLSLDRQLILIPAWAVSAGREIRLDYTDPSSADDRDALQSLDGQDLPSFSSLAVVNQVPDSLPPTLRYGATSQDGIKLFLTFSEMLSGPLPDADAFSVVVAGTAATVTDVAQNGDIIELSLASPVTDGQVVTVSYSDGSDADVTSAIQDSNGDDAPAFSGEVVRNTVGTHVYFISTTGSDTTGDGSEANPFASLTKVHSLTGDAALQGGDMVYFLEGTYRNSNFGDGNIWKDGLSDFVLLLNRSGTAGNPITYAAAPGAYVVLEFDGPGAIRLQNAQHVNVQGFDIRGQNGGISLEDALAHQFEYRIDTDADGSYLDEVSWFRPTTALTPGTTVLGQRPDGTDYVMPVNSTLSSLGAKTPGSYGANAIVIAGSSNHIQILNNAVHDAPGAGISSLTGADYVTIHGNDFYNNNWFTPSGTHAISFKNISSSDTFAGAKVIVDGNTFSDNHSRVISWAPLQNDAVDMVVDEGKTIHVQNTTTASGWTHGQVLFSNNLIVRSGNAAITVNNAERIVMANNTIVDSGYLNHLIELGLVDPNIHEGFQVSASGFRLGGTSLTVINNLISSSAGQTINGALKPLNVVDATAAVTGSGTGASLFASNLYFNGTEFLRTTTGNAALDAGFTPVDSVEALGFIDPATGNYFLLRTSPAINQGGINTTNADLVLPEDLTGLVRDGLVDLGAFEFLGDALPPAPGTLSVSGKDNDLDNSFSLVLSGQETGSSVVLQRSDDAGTTWADTAADQTGLAPGSYAYRAQVSDAAGNTSLSAAVDVTVANPYASPDTTPPAAPVITDVVDNVGSDTIAHAGDISDDATPTLTITAAPGSVVRVFDHGNFLGTATETATPGTFTYTTPSLPVGGHSFTVRASDSNGNLSDASAPYWMSVGVTETILHGGVTYNMGFTVTDKDNRADGSYTLVATGQAAGDTVQYRQSPNGTSSWGGLGSGPSPFTKEDSEASGTYYYQARVDFDGGTGYDWTSPTLSVTVDTGAAVASIDTTAPSKPTLVSSAPFSGGQVLTLTLAADAGSSVVIFDGSTPLGVATEGGSGTFTFTTGTLASGIHPLSWRAIDAAGNASDLSTPWIHAVTNNDNSAVNEAPTDVRLSPAAVAGDASVGTTLGSLSTIDPDPGDTFTYSLVSGAGSTDNAAFTIDGSAIKMVTAFDVQARNSYSIRVRSTDAGGLFTEKALTIRVIDQPASEADIPITLDSDGDGIVNVIDTDDDNDGVLDNDDGQPLNPESRALATELISVAPIADAPVRGNSSSNANANYGSAATAETRNTQRSMLMKFSVPPDGVLQSATLKLSTKTENDPLDVFLLTDNSWTESGVTFNNAPWETGVFLGETGSPSAGVYSFTLPQNAALASGRTVSLYVEDPVDPNGNVEELYTRETAGKAPILLIEKSAESPLEFTLSNAQAYLDGGSFTVNVSMKSIPTDTVYVPLAVSDPSVASIAGASVLTFRSDNWETPQTVEITPNGVGDFTLVARPLHSDDPAFNGVNLEDFAGFKVTAIDLAAGTAVEATTGEILSQNLQPTSAVGSTYFRWQLISGPQGLNVVENTGRLTFRPTSDQAGLNTSATLQATDEFGNTARFELPVTVASGVNTDPVGVYVVPRTGSDSTGDGSAANPYGTIDHAIAQANATGQSTVFIRGGEYSFGSSKQAITTAANSEIVVKPLPGEHVKLNFSGFTGFDITSTARNITFEELEIDGGSDAADFWDIVSVGFWDPNQVERGGGIAFNVDGQFITIRDNYIHDAYQKAVEIKDGRYVEVDGNIIRQIATTSLSGGHGIMRQQKGAEFFDDDLANKLRWEITGNMIFNVEQRIYSWVPSKGFIDMVLDEGKPILIDDPKDTDGSQERMAARISNNVVAYGAIDGIRLKSTPNLEVSNNTVFSQAPLADGVTDRDGDTSTPKFTNFKFTNNAVKVTPSRFAVEIDDAVADTGAGAMVSGNVVGGGLLKPSGQSGITNLADVELFTDAINGDFSINPALGLSGVGVAPAILSELDARAAAFGVEIGWDRWDVDHLKLTQTILDNIPGVNDGVAGNEIAFTDQGTFNASRTTLYFSTVSGQWKTDRGAASSIEFHLNDDYSSWYNSIDDHFKQVDGSDYGRIRWGDSVFAQDQVFAADGLLVAQVHGSGSSTQITAAGRSVALGGDLLIDFESYTPSAGAETYDLLTAGRITGRFDQVRFSGPMDRHYVLELVSDTTLRLTISDSSIATTGTVLATSPVTSLLVFGRTENMQSELGEPIALSEAGIVAFDHHLDINPFEENGSGLFKRSSAVSADGGQESLVDLLLADEPHAFQKVVPQYPTTIVV